MASRPVFFSLALLLASVRAHSHANGMDMSMDGAMDLPMGNMLTYFHFAPGDMLLFLGWVPATAGAMVGTCIGLFLLALVERWIAAMRAVMEAHWTERLQIAIEQRANVGLPVTKDADGMRTSSVGSRVVTTARIAPPFKLAHDLPRGIVHTAQAALQFSLMLITMTYNVGFILSIVIGAGVGEALFGRYSGHGGH